MATTAPVSDRVQNPRGSNLDVDWLLHGKREFTSPPTKDKEQGDYAKVSQDARPSTPPQNAATIPSKQVLAQTPPTPQNPQPSRDIPQRPQPAYTQGNSVAPSSPASSVGQPQTPPEDSKRSGKSKRESKRSSWFSSLGNKISGSSSSSSRNGSVETQSPKAAAQSPKLEFQNPFDKNATATGQQSEQQKPEVLTHHVPQGPRRPSVLVAAGTETKLDSPGFLTSALRRLSSGTAVTLGKGAGSANNLTPRRVLNVDPNRERTKIPEFEQNKLKRVAFCVDVEIAGVASQADEDSLGTQPVGYPATSNASKSNEAPANRRSSASAKFKEQAEGAALKHAETVVAEKEERGGTREDLEAEKRQQSQQRKDISDTFEGSPPTGETEDGAGIGLDSTLEKPITRKKEKKKRSEAERKERRERKRRHAEMNGLVPLEITRDDDDSDSSSNNTPAGSSTPRNGDHPTINPLRIYKRCCQLRETTALSVIKDQISKPAATLAEAPGTVPVVDLSGSKMSLQDITTFGDWLAVVPVRKLILDDCALGDEAIRIVLSGLLGCKTSEQARQNRRLPRLDSSKPGREQLSVIERLSLKNNSAITSKGWKHIALFIHLSRSLCAIDLTGIPYPVSTSNSARTNANSAVASGTNEGPVKLPMETSSLIARAIHDRFGTKLEELILSGCSLSAHNISELIDAAIHCRIRRLGLAGNHLNSEAMGHVVRYAVSNVCEGLDLGSNNLHGNEHLLSQVINDQNPMFALSLADCHLTPEDLQRILPSLCEMKNLKFIDLSRNHGLFDGASNAIPILRKRMPKMRSLKRIHLVDVGLKPEDVIALADILPDCPSLAHVNILENEPLVKAMNSSRTENQEEAAAFLSSLMTATRVSRTLVAVELEVPSSESSEVVKALSQQVVAYSLRNMERSALSDFGVESKAMPDKDAPEVLLHLVGHMEGYPETADANEPAPDEDYLIASSGIVKALNVCLVNRSVSRAMTPTASGAGTPRQGPAGVTSSPMQWKRPRDVSLELCEAARKIRLRLQVALVKEDKAGNHETYRRLAFLEQTLEGIIHRFEDEYPDARSMPDVPSLDLSSSAPDTPILSRMSSVQESNRVTDPTEFAADHEPSILLKHSPLSSSTSLASKALALEEGRMHKFGQSMRRGLLKPVGTDDFQHGTSINDQPEPAHIATLRSKLNDISGEEIRERVERQGADEVVRELEITAAELRYMAKEDPVGFEALRNSSLMNEVNGTDTQAGAFVKNGVQPQVSSSFHSEVTS